MKKSSKKALKKQVAATENNNANTNATVGTAHDDLQKVTASINAAIQAVRKANNAQPARRGSKKAKVMALVAKPKGATNEEIQVATKWQAHTIRGFLSIARKNGQQIGVVKRENGEQAYHLAQTHAAATSAAAERRRLSLCNNHAINNRCVSYSISATWPSTR